MTIFADPGTLGAKNNLRRELEKNVPGTGSCRLQFKQLCECVTLIGQDKSFVFFCPVGGQQVTQCVAFVLIRNLHKALFASHIRLSCLTSFRCPFFFLPNSLRLFYFPEKTLSTPCFRGQEMAWVQASVVKRCIALVRLFRQTQLELLLQHNPCFQHIAEQFLYISLVDRPSSDECDERHPCFLCRWFCPQKDRYYD